MKAHSLYVPVIEIIICSQLFVPSLLLPLPCSINLVAMVFFFKLGNMDEIDSAQTPRKSFGKCYIFLFALFVLSSDTREHCIPSTAVLQPGSQMKKKHRAVPHYYRI